MAYLPGAYLAVVNRPSASGWTGVTAKAGPSRSFWTTLTLTEAIFSGAGLGVFVLSNSTRPLMPNPVESATDTPAMSVSSTVTGCCAQSVGSGSGADGPRLTCTVLVATPLPLTN